MPLSAVHNSGWAPRVVRYESRRYGFAPAAVKVDRKRGTTAGSVSAPGIYDWAIMRCWEQELIENIFMLGARAD
jgi:hypothetical protein